MKSIMPIRRAFAVRTAFNILGPMTNPAGAQAQVLGVYAPHLVRLVAETLARLDTRHAFVVHGGGMDEFSISGATSVAEVKAGEVRLFSAAPADFGLSAAPIETLAGGDARTNAAILRAIFAGELGPRRDVVVMNAAAVLVTANLAEDFLSGARLAQDTIDAGKVVRLVESLAAEPRQTR
jgi:anthranilate phosphoribosyltransferase